MAGDHTARWDVVVIGAGPAGENAAQYAIQGSDRTAVIIEAELVGGECSYWACMPSKALLRPVEALDAAGSVAGVRIGAGAGRVAGLDTDAVLARRDAFTHHHDDSSQVEWAEQTGIDVLRGRGRLAAARTVEVSYADGTVRVVRARQAVVLGTGTSAAVPPVPGLREARPWISRDVTNLREVPARVAILGGGVVACEAAVWLRGLGAASVTLLVRGPRLLTRNEPFAGERVAARFAELGVQVRTATSIQRVERATVADTGVGRVHGGSVRVELDGGDSLTVDELVVATGRVPATTDLGLERIGLPAGGYLATDHHLAVLGPDGAAVADAAGPWLYAVGDVNGRALLTHMGKYQGRVCGAAVAARAAGLPLDDARTRLTDTGAPPQVAFTDPQVASVGPTEADARARGIDVRSVEIDLGAVAGAALLRDGYAGRAKLVVDRSAGTVIGATFVGPDVAELLHAATVAVVGQVPLERLWHTVPAYPTVSEIWLRLLESLPADVEVAAR